MNRKAYTTLRWLIALAALSGCKDYESDMFVTDPVKSSVAFSVSNAPATVTRMSDAVTQASGDRSQYRDMDMPTLVLIPFSKQGKIEREDQPMRLFDGTGYEYFKDNVTASNLGAFYLYQGFTMMRGTASFLVYGKASETSPAKPDGVTAKAFYGSLTADIPTPQVPAGITFSPEGITTKETASPTASLLAGYLTYIAEAQTSDGTNTITWANTGDSRLKAFYLNFTGQQNNSNMLMAGSSASVMAHVNALYGQIGSLDYTAGSVEAALKTNILDRIKNYTASGLTLTFTGDRLTSLGPDYPANIGLPDGAAALLWAPRSSGSGYAFIPQMETSTIANMNTISRYCYPAALYYYANSLIDTSNKDMTTIRTAYNSSADWTELINNYEIKSGVVNGNTTSVAIQDPLQYGVARLQVSIQSESSLTDAKGNTVTLTATATAFPLTGIIVSSQHQVGFDFKPLGTATGVETHADDKFVYDSQTKKSSGDYYYLNTTKQTVPSTLVLQSYDGEEVSIILEFRNNSGRDFYGKNGIIYQGTKFYLIGKVKPEEKADPADHEKRVFTQDYMTEVEMKTVSDTSTKSLANAYNVLPDILGGRLEVGVVLTPKWYFSTPTNVIME
ncbi:MAG: hypothetical protein IJT53_02590 [Prevotella sp.]|nr:hypothetical protein [Prevotella sp.]